MHISLVGINHRTAPITIRERAAIGVEKLHDSLLLLRRYVPCGIILSTCNRTEVYTTGSDVHQSEVSSLDFLKAYLNIPEADLPGYVYVLKDVAAAEHLFRVAGGLDSMVVGEFEILGQVGLALEVAEKVKMVNLPLRHIFQAAIRAGRRVREETGISKNALSVSSVAVDLAEQVIGDLGKCKMLVIGTGEAGRLVIKVAKDRGVSQVTIASRTRERASALAETMGAVPIGLSNLVEELKTCNVVVTCAGAPRRILDYHRVAEAMRSRPELPLVLIDIAVPRNVEPAVSQIDRVFLYNIDDLTQISERNRQRREGEIESAQEIIAAEVDKFAAWWWSLEVRPLISALMKKAEDIRSTQLSRTLKKLRPISDEERDSLEAMTKSIINKVLQDPVRYLKANVSADDYAEMVSELFRLDGEKRA